MTSLDEAEQTAAVMATAVAEIYVVPAVTFADQHSVTNLVRALHSKSQRDIVIVDKNKRILADAIPANVGLLFNHDSDNEVGRTLRDGAQRTFIERSPDYPEGIHQVVVPIRTAQDGIIGALVFDYEARFRQVQANAWQIIVKQAGLSILVLFLMQLSSRRIVYAIVDALHGLMEAVAKLGNGDMTTPIRRMSRDEIGDVADAMEKMRLSLQQAQNNLHMEVERRTEAEGKATQRSTELENAMARMKIQNREVTLRNDLGDLLQSCISLGEAGVVIERFAPQLFEGASGAVYLMAASGAETLAAVARWGTATPSDALVTTDCWALRRGKTHLMTTDNASPLCTHVGEHPAGITSICVPLSAHGEALGLLHITSPEIGESGSAVMLEKQELAEALATQVGMALANLRLRETLLQKSILDVLTGLYNLRYLEDALPRELSRAHRAGQTLAVFMIDVDHFKKFNDDYGHEVGDMVLKALGKTLRDNCRQSDSSCRFGGEEFTMILPDTNLAQAREWGERLIHRVRAMEVKNGSTVSRITISMGLALYPEHGNDAETLLQVADLALYDAKHAGRDRQMVYGENAMEKT